MLNVVLFFFFFFVFFVFFCFYKVCKMIYTNDEFGYIAFTKLAENDLLIFTPMLNLAQWF